jgi:hypothetical protein
VSRIVNGVCECGCCQEDRREKYPLEKDLPAMMKKANDVVNKNDFWYDQYIGLKNSGIKNESLKTMIEKALYGYKVHFQIWRY